MTTEGVARTSTQLAGDDERQFCYRHPQRETYVRCGRCDRPICTGCAMQGPVGLRCRQCGRPAYDPLTSFTPRQLLLGISTAVAGGLLVGFIGAQIGFFSIILAFIGGRFIADGVRRVVGYKQGRTLLTVTVVGILAGALAGYGVDMLLFELPWIAELAAEGIGPGFYLPQVIVWGLIDGGAACVGAYYRLR